MQQSTKHSGYLCFSYPGSSSLTSGNILSRDLLHDSIDILLLVEENILNSVLVAYNYVIL
jgi:hypothetical protein